MKILLLEIRGSSWLDIMNNLVKNKENLFWKVSEDLGKGKKVTGNLHNIRYQLKDEAEEGECQEKS